MFNETLSDCNLQICADGATSRLATHLGYCTEAPRGVCSRAFVEGGSHNTDFDGGIAGLCVRKAICWADTVDAPVNEKHARGHHLINAVC